ncbi:AAA family ATPase [Myxococcus sp. K38C18041901]|uniref:AAA family ATPase n=1 Tax=Myxococcus guangdongensis TaxID=2906760 RepID=UPI0020A6E776|nr:AAA family ATPase [Myxococcus guangdongensis]MCP3058660.1 AAA family ATPase [Myxococcus guangdongensis]
MKVLGIRGSNLTSFSGNFELELDRPPLDRLGLFAITGATGAGKSTLLDALCLALFDRTPRLGGRGGVPVGRADEEEEARLSAYDVRGLLRRGAAEGFAEVDFQGKDGKRYRARWNVWRARGRAEGRFRPQEMSLTEVASGQQFGRTKGEVLVAIQERLGLSFDQFRRSALLAQGEFAAFLKADASERAELLERMTGTEVYSRLSIRAHEKNKAEQEALAKREQGLAAIVLMEAQERGAAEERLVDEARARAEVETKLRQAEGAAAWHAERSALVRAFREAEEREVRAAQALEAAAPRARKLEEVRAAESFREVVTAAEVAGRRWEDAEGARRSRAEEVEATKARAFQSVGVLKGAEEARAAARTAQEEATPALEEAAALDARCEATARDAEDARARARASKEEEAKAREVLEAVGAREEEARAKGEAARAWLVEKAHWEALAKEWPRWQRELEWYEVALGEGSAARTQVETQRAEVERLRESTRLRTRERETAAEAEARAQAAATHAEAALGEGTAVERRVLRESLLARRESLRALESARQGLCSAESEARRAEQEAVAARGEAESASVAVRQAAERRLEGDAALKEARRSLSVAQATQGHAAQRALLREGEACPLCGATEHPYRHELPALDGLVAESAARVETLESERAECSRAEVEASAKQAAARARMSQSESRRDNAKAQCVEHGAAWGRGREQWQRVEGEAARSRQARDSRDAASSGAGHTEVIASTVQASDAGTVSGKALRHERAAHAGASSVHSIAGALGSEASAEGSWGVVPSETEVPPEAGASVEAGTWLESMVARVQARLAALKSEEEAAEGLERAAREARASLETQRSRREVAVDALRRAEEAFTRAESALREGLARVEAADAVVRQVLADVAPIFAADAGWEGKLEAAPADFRQKCGKRVSMWKEREKLVEDAKALEKKEQEQRARAQGQLEVSTRRAEDDAAQAALKEQARADATRARAVLLGGRPTQEVRAELKAKLDTALAAYEQARVAADASRQAESVTLARLEDAVRSLASALETRETARVALDHRLSAQGLSLDVVKALLAHDAAWCEAEARALSVLREAQAQARAVRDERRERHTTHEQGGPPSLSEEEASAARTQLRDDVEVRRRAEAMLRARLESDDAARARHGSEAQALAELRRAGEVWKVLGDLIGSHDGKRFKVFAQSLTLDALLLHANAHLQELARRYRLMRVPGHDLDLQVVDGDMGDEVRGVASLSGGESFLVSLALALGLASLSSETTQVETLFIDEGFGTLDPETLEVALATLDALQATGRQVGIISHVSGLAERIGVQVRVVKQGGGRSRLVVEGDLGIPFAEVRRLA